MVSCASAQVGLRCFSSARAQADGNPPSSMFLNFETVTRFFGLSGKYALPSWSLRIASSSSSSSPPSDASCSATTLAALTTFERFGLSAKRRGRERRRREGREEGELRCAHEKERERERKRW